MGRILSVEIKNRNIKILEGTKSGSSLTIYKSLFLDIEPGSIDDGKIIDMDSVVATVETALTEHNIKSKNAIFIINTNSTVTRNMELPLLKSKTETMSMIKSELDQLLPVDLNQYKLVYKKTDSVTSDGTEKGKYIVYGLPIGIYEQYIELAQKLKLELVAIDLASNCLDKIAGQKLTINKENLKSGTASAFIDIGYSNISFCVVNNGKDDFSRISSNGIYDIVKNYGTVFELSQEEAMNEIQTLPLGENVEILSDISKINILEDNINMWIDEFNRYIRYYNSNNKERQIEKIYIYGSFAKIIGLEYYLESHLNIDTEMINEVSNVVIKDSLTESNFDIKSYLIPLLSLYIDKNDINFLTDKKKKHKSKFNANVGLMAVGLILFLTLAFYIYSYMVEKSSLEKEIATMDEFISNEENIKTSEEAIAMKNKALLLKTYKNEVDKLKTAIRNEDAVTTIMFEQVASSIPVGTKVNSMSIDKSSIQLQCSSASRQEVAQFEKNLKAVEFIDNVYIPAVVDSAEGGNFNYSYSVICDIKDVIVNEAE
ncbi:MAG: pilus assembly protein PilM [Sedimentibacter sp.]|uniref:pilus assembly protein PilM n=1 Tax=Sedimentibacter sp. TaxID=1960295 RepID=UPI00298108C3|nr:pilus assembly protein PilM [Sedimentibacter sp.]MDW5300403.1 pilus assembly protein PilM [Sedimentibacter sp.]